MSQFRIDSGKNYREFWVYFREQRSKLYTFAKFQSQRKFPKKYRFFGISPVFWKNTGVSERISQNYAQSSILVPSFRAIANFWQKYRFFEILPVFWKNTRNCEFISEKNAQRSLPMQSFRVIGKFLQKYRFFGILPVAWINARNFDMISEFYDQNNPIPEPVYFPVLAPNHCGVPSNKSWL